MKTIKRNIIETVSNDLEDKMVLLAGPRQCGKTTLAKELQKEIGGKYYNHDIAAHRKILRDNRMEEGTRFWIFDEIHKNARWRNWLKGVYDQHCDNHSILVTGSAKLNIYSRGGDSLQGRYFFHRLHPFTLSEVLGKNPVKNINTFLSLSDPASGCGAVEALLQLLELSGFPEPFLSGTGKKSARWRMNYSDRLIREEIATLQNLRDLDLLELLHERLLHTVGSVLSINSLREDLEVAFETVRNWLTIFENVYTTFRLSPYGPPRIKAVKKEQKLYFWDWGGIENRGARFENFVAFHLLRLQHWCEDVEGEKIELRYFRDTRGHEVDFVVLKKGAPWFVVEVKLSEKKLDKNLKYFLERVKVPYAFQIYLEGEEDYCPEDINGCKIRILPAARFLSNLP